MQNGTGFQNGMKKLQYKVMHKLLLGSDYPVTTPADTIAGLRKINDFTPGTMLPRISEADIESLIHRNTLELLGLA